MWRKTKLQKIGLEKGNYFEPTLMTGVTPEMKVFSEEILDQYADCAV